MFWRILRPKYWFDLYKFFPIGIQYHGNAGITASCRDAIYRLILCGPPIERALILTSSNHHCFLLTVHPGDIIAIKSGFASGYGGEGPHGFSEVISVLDSLDIEIEECDVSPKVIQKIDDSCLTYRDLEKIEALPRVTPWRWPDYLLDIDINLNRDFASWRHVQDVMPYSLIDERLMDLATRFWNGPDDKIMRGYRRLEDIVRERSGLDEHGSKLFSKAFSQTNGALTWSNLSPAEIAGRVELITGTFKALRNRRAHREDTRKMRAALIEFLQLNHLFVLESQAVESDKDSHQN